MNKQIEAQCIHGNTHKYLEDTRAISLNEWYIIRESWRSKSALRQLFFRTSSSKPHTILL